MLDIKSVLNNMNPLDDTNFIYCDGVRCCESTYVKEKDGCKRYYIHLVPWIVVPLADEITTFMQHNPDVEVSEAPELYREVRALGDKMLAFIHSHTWVYKSQKEYYVEVMDDMRNTIGSAKGVSDELLFPCVLDMLCVLAEENGVPEKCMPKLKSFYIGEVKRLFNVEVEEKMLDALRNYRKDKTDTIPNLTKCFESIKTGV